MNSEESLWGPIVRVYADGSMVSEKTYDDIAAQDNLVIDSDIPESKKVVVEVTGMYMDTPDLCYNRIEFAYVKSQQAEEEIEHFCPIPAGAEEKWGKNGLGMGAVQSYHLPDKNSRHKGVKIMVGPYKAYYTKGGQIQVDGCYDENGKEHGWRTFYDRKGNIRTQFLFEHGKRIFIKYDNGKLVNKQVK